MGMVGLVVNSILGGVGVGFCKGFSLKTVFCRFRLPFQTASRQPRRSGVDARRFSICVPYLSGINARPTAAGGLVCADATEGWAIAFSGCLWKIKAA